MAEQNAYQIADWNGQTGERWVANQARLDAMLAVFGQAAIEAEIRHARYVMSRLLLEMFTNVDTAADYSR
jgi:hypothetical protein